MGDLLEQKPTVDTRSSSIVDLSPLLTVLDSIDNTLRRQTPSQRALVKLVDGGTPTAGGVIINAGVCARLQFENAGRRVKSFYTYVSPNVEGLILVSWDGPVTVDGTGVALNGHIMSGFTQIPTEITELYILLLPGAGAPAAFTINNMEPGTTTPIVRIDAYTNPEEGLA